MAIHYTINPSGSGSILSEQQIISAITTAAETWMQADPSVVLVYEGTTTASPGTSAAGNNDNVVGFVTTAQGLAQTDHTPTTGSCTYSGFDVRISAGNGVEWEPCDPAHGNPCGDNESTNGYDLQAVLTHEWGHVLGLGHPVTNEDDSLLTMVSNAASTPGSRHADTLAYGDVLGERSLYSTSAPFPPLYYP